jgi:AcrR family transcriptional regulator
MLGETVPSWQDRRREAARLAILDAAWDVARADGIANLTLRAVAERVGMRPPSLYSHFSSKHAIYDAMFGQAWQALEDRIAATPVPEHPREAMRAAARTYVMFSVEDLARHQLMDQRVIPDFTPSPENYAPAVRVLDRFRRTYWQITGRTGDPDVDPDADEDMDLYVLTVSGLVATQWSNDPGGTRYIRLLDRVVDLLADDLGLPPTPSEPVHGEENR